ncbi:PAS domain-containing sensor histidine kinase [Desulfonatronovibrio magnus]|uniref:PAS domain-containing sensor histidine kinase n=1 Tax=Desulfonatronovibrio magnus TaxID=698827 RepID=UPI0006960DAC|nr:PAS domain-containing sensor histidine kinase [Desulfonatronovibrio magnus]
MNLFNSLRTKLALWIALFACVLAMLGAILSLWLGYKYLETNFQNNIQSHMRLASISLIQPVMQINYLELRDQIQAIQDYEGITGVAIYDQNDNLLMESGELSEMQLSEDIGSGPAVQGQIIVSFSQDPLKAGMMYILYIGGILLLIIVPAFIFIVWKISHKYLFDLSELTECIKNSSCEEMPQYPGIYRQDEVGLLSTALRQRDQELSEYHQELENYKNHLEQLVEQRTVELKRSQMLSQTILDGLPDSVALIDARDMTILNANQTFLSSNNTSLEDVLGKTCYQITHGTDEPCQGVQHTCPVQEYFKNNQPCVAEHIHKSKDGDEYFVEVSAWPVFDENGQPVQMIHIERDISEKKRVEKLRDDVERIVRHDLKTPLNGILGLSEILLDDELNDEQKEFLGHIHESGRRMLNMINHSLDIFKMEEGTYILKPEEFDLLSVLKVLDSDTQPLQNGKLIKLQIILYDREISDDNKLSVYLEKRHIHSMLANLLTNALEAAPENSMVTVNINQDQNNTIIDLHNDGAIPSAVRNRFFDRYATAGKAHGTGLGTFSARLIARSHGGDITFTTSEEHGTHVIVTLPTNAEKTETTG